MPWKWASQVSAPLPAVTVGWEWWELLNWQQWGMPFGPQVEIRGELWRAGSIAGNQLSPARRNPQISGFLLWAPKRKVAI